MQQYLLRFHPSICFELVQKPFLPLKEVVEKMREMSSSCRPRHSRNVSDQKNHRNSRTSPTTTLREHRAKRLFDDALLMASKAPLGCWAGSLSLPIEGVRNKNNSITFSKPSFRSKRPLARTSLDWHRHSDYLESSKADFSCGGPVHSRDPKLATVQRAVPAAAEISPPFF